MSQTFIQFAESHGLKIGTLRDDGKIRRCPTFHRPRKENGAYQYEQGRGWVQNWEHGDTVHWFEDENAKPWTEAEKKEADRKRQEQARKRAKLALEAARRAADMLSRAELLTPRPGRDWKPGRPAILPVLAHPYFVSKGFPQEPGMVLGGELLLIPMRDCSSSYELVGLQQIDRGGRKLFLKDQRADMAVYCMGQSITGPTWLVEGYATGLSLREALRRLYRQDAIIVCFSAGNLRKVAARGVGWFVMADNDHPDPNREGFKAGEEAAKATGLRWTMPPTVGDDANDLHRRDGIEALVALVQALVRSDPPTSA